MSELNETTDDIARRIVTVRGQRIVLDEDLALLYGVPTKALNQAIKRNAKRFPSDFVFQLVPEELASLSDVFMRSQNVTASKRNVRHPPSAFTEHGAIMAATILNSPRAVEMSVFVVRAFIKMREQLIKRADMEARLAQVEKTLLQHDAGLRDLYQKIRPLLLPTPAPVKKSIGFHAKEPRGHYGVVKKGKGAK